MKQAFHKLLTQLKQIGPTSTREDDGQKQVKSARYTSWRQTRDDYLSVRAKRQPGKVR